MSIFYIIFIILTAYYSFRYDRIEEYNAHKQHRLWLMCGYMICLTGFSYGLGADKFVYMEQFDYYPTTIEEFENYMIYNIMVNGYMPLWTLVNMLSKILTGSFYTVQILESLAINSIVCYLISKHTHRFFLFLLLYFFSLQFFIFNTEIMREGFALALVLLGIEGWINGKKWILFITIPLGILFHVSAAIVAIFPFIKFRISTHTISIALFTSIFIWTFSDILLNKVIIISLNSIGLGSLIEKIFVYSVQRSTLGGYVRSVLTYLVIPSIVMYTVIQAEENEKHKEQLRHLMSFAIFIGIIASSFAGFYRFYNYVQIYFLIWMSEFVFSLLRTRRHLIIRAGTLTIWGLLVFIFLYRIHYKTTNTYFYEFFYPYTCILHEDRNVYFREIAHSEGATMTVSDNNVREIK